MSGPGQRGGIFEGHFSVFGPSLRGRFGGERFGFLVDNRWPTANPDPSHVPLGPIFALSCYDCRHTGLLPWPHEIYVAKMCPWQEKNSTEYPEKSLE